MSAGDALYRVKVIWVDSSGRALRSGCPHCRLKRHRNSPALHGHSTCQPGQSLTLLGYHPGKVHWEEKKKLCGHGNSIHLPFWTAIQCKGAVRPFGARQLRWLCRYPRCKMYEAQIWYRTCVFLIIKIQTNNWIWITPFPLIFSIFYCSPGRARRNCVVFLFLWNLCIEAANKNSNESEIIDERVLSADSWRV